MSPAYTAALDVFLYLLSNMETLRNIIRDFLVVIRGSASELSALSNNCRFSRRVAPLTKNKQLLMWGRYPSIDTSPQ
jgi:hypothetical protein